MLNMICLLFIIYHLMNDDITSLKRSILNVHCPPKVKVQPALLFSSFEHNSSVYELKNMKLSEHICYEMIN